jgi:branched-chain amino acid transport system ATP-binding protein
MSSLEVRDIVMNFGGFRALDGVSLTVPGGGLVGLIGPNGAGKSTLFAIMSGFQTQDGGTVLLDGRPLDALGAPARARAGLVRTFKVPREFRNLTVRQNLLAAAPGQTGENLLGLFFQPGRVAREEAVIARRAEETLALLKLTPVADQPARQLSGGQKKLLELGRALMLDPRFVLLDEPFAGVNPVLIGEIMARIRELNAGGIGFLIIEHDLEALTRLVPYLAVLDRGRIIAEGAPGAVLADAQVREAYLGGVA